MSDNVSIIDIDVNDEKFRSFYAIYQKYEANLTKMPEEWRKAASSMILGSKEMSKFVDKTNAAASGMERMKVASEKTANALKTIAGTLLKIGGIGIALSGIGAIFTGAGLRSLSNSAIADANAGARLGLSGGAYKAWQTFMARRFGENPLSAISAAQKEGNKSGQLSLLAGVSANEAQTMNADELTFRILQNIGRKYKNAKPSQRNKLFQDVGLSDVGLSIQDAMLASENLDILQPQYAKYQQAKGAYTLSRGQTNAIGSVGETFSNAGNRLETFFQRLLAGNAKGFNQTILALEGSLERLVKNILTPENLSALENAMEEFAQYLGSQDFKDNLETFAQIIEKIVSGSRWILGVNTKEEERAIRQKRIANDVARYTESGMAGKAAREDLSRLGVKVTPLPAGASVVKPPKGEFIIQNQSGAYLIQQSKASSGVTVKNGN